MSEFSFSFKHDGIVYQVGPIDETTLRNFIKDQCKWLIRGQRHGIEFVEAAASIVRRICPSFLAVVEEQFHIALDDASLYELSQRIQNEHIEYLIRERLEREVQILRTRFSMRHNVPRTRAAPYCHAPKAVYPPVPPFWIPARPAWVFPVHLESILCGGTLRSNILGNRSISLSVRDWGISI